MLAEAVSTVNNSRPDAKSTEPVFALAYGGDRGLLQFPRLAGVFTDRWGADATTDIIEIATFEKIIESDFRRP